MRSFSPCKWTSPWLVGVVLLLALPPASAFAATVTADVVALDQVFFWNRRGACQPQGQIFALAQDVFPDGADESVLANSCAFSPCTPGQVHLRESKRPRPIALRMNVGDTLTIQFKNLLNPIRANVKQCPDCRTVDELGNPIVANADEQVNTRDASIHVIGMQLVGGIASDGSNVGTNSSSLVAPGDTASYSLFAEREGQHVLYSAGATTTGEGDGGQLNAGLFGSVNVEPAGATWYRSQVTAADMALGLDTTHANSCAGTPGITCPLPGEVAGHPIIKYDTVYPAGHPRAGLPIFEMLQGGKIVHSDLTAIIAGPFTQTYPLNPSYPERNQPFREFTLIYHDEIGAVDAFPEFFEDPVLGHTLHSVRDAFAINYGTGGIGSEILANRLGVGPEGDCLGCKYEEFFLTSWVLGDPAMNVDIPANASDPANGVVATEAFYPDDPSNVYHSYLRDHVKFRLLHGGSKEHHIHHLHAHQWLYAPDSDNSAYLDSQAFGPGASFTLEMVYNSSGNRNQTVGDSIFHCHFYPHFAMGMWSLWRVHDVFEDGSRLLPDGEIAGGTPIPGLVGLPGLPLAPMPGAAVTVAQDPRFDPDGVGPLPNKRGGQVQINGKFVRDMTAADIPGLGNPGYPFFIPGAAGSRPPHPALDTIDDGGLPRHILLAGEAIEVHTRLDFTKEIEEAEALPIPETGAPVEEAAMAAHEVRFHDTVLPDGSPATDQNHTSPTHGFIYNGAPRVAGAPYAEPCIGDDGEPRGRGTLGASGTAARLYKAAAIQLDTVFNKAGWHFPQQRMLTLWDDVAATYAGTRPPEPFFFRANSEECIEYQHTNLVPNIYELDDFQVRTPTDILGQHIHLVKFDVTSSDGSGNGWNYEDGTFSPDEVIERINAIRLHNDCNGAPLPGAFCPVATPHPQFGVLGAQTTVQRWWADPVLNNDTEDRTLRTVFTHDHFGPSTHQQTGLYAGLVVEPTGSTWFQNETGIQLGGGPDGGPTSWQATIETADPVDSYREFLLEFQDFALAYLPGGSVSGPNGPGTGPVLPLPWNGVARQPGEGFDDRPNSINPPAKVEVGLPLLLQRAPLCPGGAPPPCPEAISADDPGTFTVNYRNEPLALRVRDPATNAQVVDPITGLVTEAGDLSHAFRSDIVRADANLNSLGFQPLTAGLFPGDPYTPLLRGYESDNVQIRILVGAHEEGHNFSFHGVKWLFEPSWEDSGFRGSQMMGISEHFEFQFPTLPVKDTGEDFADYLYEPGSAVDDLWNGNWGIMRSYTGLQPGLVALPNNPDGEAPPNANPQAFAGVCPKFPGNDPRAKKFKIRAVLAQDVLGPDGLVYNSRGVNGGPLHDPTAILFFNDQDFMGNGQLKPGVPIEPLVLRANAGDCIDITLVNRLPEGTPTPDLAGFNTLPMIVDDFNANQVRPSSAMGLHAQLVAQDISISDGANVGFNPVQTVAPGEGDGVGGALIGKYKWYAGDLTICDGGQPQDKCLGKPDGTRVATPIEFGAINLMSSDRIKHSNKAAIGALIIEPEGASWVVDADDPSCGGDPALTPRCSRTSATVTHGTETFREFVVLFQDDINMRCAGCGSDPSDADAVPNLADSEDPEDSAQKALNYKTEPMWLRWGFAPNAPLHLTKNFDISEILRNDFSGIGDPETPVFLAAASTPVRFRVLEPGGHARNHVFQVHGHVWEQEPYVNGSTRIGDNPLSMWEGARMGHGPTNHFDAVLKGGAGGKLSILGDYLFRDHASFQFDGGLWGILRVKQ